MRMSWNFGKWFMIRISNHHRILKQFGVSQKKLWYYEICIISIQWKEHNFYEENENELKYWEMVNNLFY